MYSGRCSLLPPALLCAVTLCLSGCGRSDSKGTAAQPTSAAVAQAGGSPKLTTVAINASTDDDDDDAPDSEPLQIEEPKPGTPEWLIRQIVMIWLEPVGPQAPAEDASEAEKQQYLDAVSAAQREREAKVAKLATEAIALSHKDPAKEQIFNAAVHHLLRARLQLALRGEQEAIDALYGDATAFYKRDPKSEAALKAALVVTDFTHANAERYGQQQPEWLTEFARQAKLFATNFPEQEARAIPMLIAAGQSCELIGKMDEALSCYALVQKQFPNSPATEEVAGVLRRLQLKGKPLQLAGPTIDGNYVSIDQFRGKVVMVVFWASNVQPFLEQVDQLAALTKKYEKYIGVIGVNLDIEEPAVESFLEAHPLTWPQIFYSDREQRGWNAPLATYYGLTNLPTVWLVDQDGVVAETRIAADQLEVKIRELVSKRLSAKSR